MWQRFRLNRVSSTQAIAKRFAQRLLKPQHLLVTAKEQIHGQGRRGRVWLSHANKGVYATFLFPFLQSAPLFIPLVSHVAALALAKTVDRWGVDSRIKWPNDLLIEGRKCAGILCESLALSSCSSPEHWSALLIGMGINTELTREECRHFDQPVTSLSIEGKCCVDKEKLIDYLQEILYQQLQCYLAQGFSTLRTSIMQKMAFLHQIVVVEDNNQLFRGYFRGLSRRGELMLDLVNGQRRLFYTGTLRQCSPCLAL